MDINPNNLVYNPAWFNQEQQSPFTEFVDNMIAIQQQQEEPSVIETQNTQSGLLEMYEEMKNMMSEIQASSQKQQLSSSEEDDYSDIEDYRVLFEEEDTNTPVDWNARTHDKFILPKNQVASSIYNEVLAKTGNQIKAQNAVKIAKKESTFNPSITNKYGMVGLFQFSPDNQKKYKVSKNSSVKEQVSAWLQYQKDNNIEIGNEGVGQLAPAYIDKKVIYKKGTKAYNANKILDLNKDGLMTAEEINNWYNL